jgi:hypothetical protein
MGEAILFDNSLRKQYEYILFPGMCECVGLVIKDKNDSEKIGAIHYVGKTNPESIVSFILKYFPNSELDIASFAGNACDENKLNLPSISSVSDIRSTIKSDHVFQRSLSLKDIELDVEEPELIALRNRYEVSYVLTVLKEKGYKIKHNFCDAVSYGSNVFLDLKDFSLSSNLNVEVVRDDISEKDKANKFFEPNRLDSHISGVLHNYLNTCTNNLYKDIGFYNIKCTDVYISDKRSWKAYVSDKNTSSAECNII